MMEGIANSPSTTEEHPPQSADEEPPPGVMSDEDINRLEQRGVSLWNLYNNTGDVNVLAEATDVIKRTLAHRPDGHPYRANSLNNLATALLSYHQRTNDVSSLAEAIDTFRSVLKIRLKGHPDYAGSCSNLGNALSAWHESTGDASVLEEATTLLQEALALADFGHPDPAGAYNNLAVTLLALYVRERKLPLVEKAMQLHRTALSLRPENHPRRPISCNNLAMSLLRYYEHTGDVIHLDEAIALQREAVELYPEGHPGRAEASLQLSTFLQRRFEHSGDTTILDETMELDVKALNMYPEGHPDRARACSNIAFAYIHQKHVEPYPQTLHTISKLLDAALALRPVGHPDYALICSNMVTIHYKQFLHTGSASHLDAAIEMARFPLHAEVGNYLIRANAFSNVAAVLLERCRINPNGGDAREVISMCDKAIELHVRQNRWRSLLTLADLYIIADTSVQSVSKSIDHLLEAVSLPCHDPWAMSSAAQMILIKLWSITNLPRESHLRLLTAFEALINTLPVLAGFALNKRMKLSSQETFGHLGPLAFASALAADRIELGLELLEHARGTLWSQELHVIDPKTGDLPPKMGSELETLLRSMTTTSFGDFETLDTRTLTASDIRHRHNNRIQALLTDIRSMPGFGRFMLGNTSAQLMEAARDHPVVVLVTVYEQSHAIVLKGSGDSPVVVSLNIKATELTGLRFSMSKDRSRGSATSMHGDSTDNRGLFMSLPNSGAEPTLRRIWTRIVKPVIEALGLQKSEGRLRPRLYWCPTGPFTFLPVHAAGIYTGPQADWCAKYVVSSYIPTVSALLRAQDRTMHRSGVSSKLLLVAEAQPANSTMNVLTKVQAELEEIRSAVAASPQTIRCVTSLEGSTTVNQMAEEMRDSSMVHLACHGIQHSQDALESGFLLGDGHLTVARLMELKLDRAFFAFLSACETAKGDEGQPDQTVHLAAAMLFAGFKSLVATMWAIADADGPTVAGSFYRALLSRGHIDADSIAFALDEAVTDLRKSGVSPHRWVPFIHFGS